MAGMSTRSHPRPHVRPHARPHRQLWFALPLAAALVLATPAQTQAAPATRTIWENNDEYVRLVARDGARGARNDHPVRIAPQTLTAIIAGLMATPAKRTKSDVVAAAELSDAIPLFSQAAASRLANALAIALRNAKPHQDAVFQIRDNASLIGFISQPVHTTGRVFWNNGLLHVIFGPVHKGIVKRMVMGRKTGVVNPPAQAARGAIARSDYRVALTQGVRYARTRGGKKRADWIVIDPDIAMSEALEAPATPRARAARAAERSLGERPLEDRLRRLKKLRRDGLISEKDYRDKVRDILDEI